MMEREFGNCSLNDNPNFIHKRKTFETFFEMYAKSKDDYESSMYYIHNEEYSGWNFDEIARLFATDGSRTILIEYQVTTKECMDMCGDGEPYPDWISVYEVSFVGDYTCDDNKEIMSAAYDEPIPFEDVEYEMTKLALRFLVEVKKEN